MRAVRWVVMTAGLMACLYLGYVHEMVGPRRVALFLVWLTGTVATLAMFIPEARKEAVKRGRAVPRWIMVPVDVAIITFLVWHGAIISAIAWLMGLIADENIFTKENEDEYKS